MYCSSFTITSLIHFYLLYCIVVLQLHHLYIFIKCSFTIKITTTITSLIHFYKGSASYSYASSYLDNKRRLNNIYAAYKPEEVYK